MVWWFGVLFRHLRRLCLVGGGGVLVGLLQLHSLSSGSVSTRFFVFLVCFVYCFGCNPTSVWAFFSSCGTLFWAYALLALFVESQLWL